MHTPSAQKGEPGSIFRRLPSSLFVCLSSSLHHLLRILSLPRQLLLLVTKVSWLDGWGVSFSECVAVALTISNHVSLRLQLSRVHSTLSGPLFWVHAISRLLAAHLAQEAVRKHSLSLPLRGSPTQTLFQLWQNLLLVNYGCVPLGNVIETVTTFSDIWTFELLLITALRYGIRSRCLKRIIALILILHVKHLIHLLGWEAAKRWIHDSRTTETLPVVTLIIIILQTLSLDMQGT